MMDAAIEIVGPGEGLTSEMMPLQIAPDFLDVI
jgi:hypothetical protein